MKIRGGLVLFIIGIDNGDRDLVLGAAVSGYSGVREISVLRRFKRKSRVRYSGFYYAFYFLTALM